MRTAALLLSLALGGCTFYAGGFANTFRIGPMPEVRLATPDDAPAMARIITEYRTEMARVQPVFWAPAPNAEAMSRGYFAALLAQETIFALVAEEEGRAVGFLIAEMRASPPVFDPGGPTCMIDDFAVDSSADENLVLEALFARAESEARSRGARQFFVVAPVHDKEKRDMLRRHGLSPAAENWTKAIP